jgi:hypothetical protein
MLLTVKNDMSVIHVVPLTRKILLELGSYRWRRGK